MDKKKQLGIPDRHLVHMTGDEKKQYIQGFSKTEYGKKKLSANGDKKTDEKKHQMARKMPNIKDKTNRRRSSLDIIRDRGDAMKKTSDLEKYRKEHPKGGPLNEHPSVKRFKEIRGY